MKTLKPRMLILVMALVLVASVVPMGRGPQASGADVLYNGGFEQGFVSNAECPGMVGAGWGCFNNGGTAVYGFYDDMWAPTVASGQNSQLIEINTKQQGGDPNRQAGIFQRALVQPGATYQMSLQGMIRADDSDTSDPWRYRVYVGFDPTGGVNWQAVSDWRELPWDTYYPRTEPGSFSSYSTSVTASGPALTVFVRVERKWGTWYEETDFNLDNISLVGPAGPYVKPVHPIAPAYQDGYTAPPAQPGDGGYTAPPAQPGDGAPMAPPPASDGGYTAPPAQPGDGAPMAPPPSSEGGYTAPPAQPGDGYPVDPGYSMPPASVCSGPNLLWNGGFENGFAPNGVAYYWTGFNNGGRANYGYYDEMWPPVVSQGTHGQLLEINSKNLPDGTDPDRVIGIAQRVYLQPGATYQLSFDAMMREAPVATDEDAYRYEVLWGYSTTGSTDTTLMTFKELVPLTTIYPRTEPGEMQSYTTQFRAPGGYTTLAIWGLKKWATVNRELDVNLDNVVLQLCSPVKPVHPIYPVHPVKPVHPIYPVKPAHPTYPSQPAQPPAPPSKPHPGPVCDEAAGDVWVTVQRGDTLSGIAAAHDTTVQAIMEKNGLSNPNMIYVNQTLCIPGQAAAVPYAAPAPMVMSQEPAVVEDVAAAATSDPELSVAAEQPESALGQPAASEISEQPVLYTVQRGDTLGAIASQHGTTVQALVQLNDIANPNHIFSGQQLRLR
ncbi:MAG: LysM peptidoglycan-binding domain-containing protein [Caldilineales bacterium]